MAAKRWDGSAWQDIKKRRRVVGVNNYTPMSGYRWDGAVWIPLWTATTTSAVLLTTLYLNLDEISLVFQPSAFNLTKDPQT